MSDIKSIGTTVRSRAAAELRDRILTGRLDVGSRIDLDELSEEFGISRTPVREALLELSYEGLVAVNPRSGITVLGLTPDDAVDNFAVLALLVGKAAELATDRITDEQLAELHELADAVAGDDVVAANRRFHRAVNLASGSRRLLVHLRQAQRVVPADHIQAAAQVSYQKDQGCKQLYILNDKEVYGKGIADGVSAGAETAGIKVVANEGIDTKAANFRSLATKIKGSGADCMFFGGIVENKAVQVWRDVHAANPTMKLFGPDGVALSDFSSKIPDSAAKVTFITNPTLDPKLYPPAAQDFFTKFKQKYGKDPEPYAIYGYEAMKVALLAIQNAGDKGNDRQAVIDAFFKIKDRDSVLGKYSIDKNGDTTLSDYGADRVKDKKLVFDKVIKAQGAS